MLLVTLRKVAEAADRAGQGPRIEDDVAGRGVVAAVVRLKQNAWMGYPPRMGVHLNHEMRLFRRRGGNSVIAWPDGPALANKRFSPPRVESAPVNHARRIVAAALAALAWTVAVAEGQPSIRIGGTHSQTGANATVSPGISRGYQLCVKHANDKGGVLGRPLELVLHDDRSDPATAAGLYEQLITRDKVDLVLGPYGSVVAGAVANVTEKHRMPMMAPTAVATPVYRKERKFIFMVDAPSETFAEGILDLAAKRGLRTVALINEDDVGGRATTQGASELAKKKGLRVVLAEAYPRGTTDFSAILTKVRAMSPDVLHVQTRVFEDGVAIARQMKALDVNPRMVGFPPVMSALAFSDALGRDAEFLYVVTSWLPELVEVRAGGLIPIARQYPGAREFVESSRKEFPSAGVSATAYGACQILVEAVKRAGSLDGAKLRDIISKMDHNTVFGRFRVDRDGVQIGHRMLLIQWQDGKRAIVWPEELAPDKPRFPTPPWSQRP